MIPLQSKNSTPYDINRFKGERSGWSPRGLHETEIKPTDFIETFAYLKTRKLPCKFCVFSYHKKQEQERRELL
jgi:hypothetical protein